MKRLEEKGLRRAQQHVEKLLLREGLRPPRTSKGKHVLALSMLILAATIVVCWGRP